MPVRRTGWQESGGRAPGKGGDEMDFVTVRQDVGLGGLAAVHDQQDGLVIAGDRHMIQQFGERARGRERHVKTP